MSIAQGAGTSNAVPLEGNGAALGAGEAASVTPMMRQYQEIKAAHPDCLLFYRMGDFYELFFQDAEIASRALGIVLTKRGKHQGADIPMCGVPVVRSEEYLHRLIAAGFRVAVCEQTEDPAEAKKRGAKSVVARDVIRLITAGTLTEDTLLDARRNNYLAAIVRARASAPDAAALFALAYLDISTGEFRVTECDRLALAAEIARIEPGEIIDVRRALLRRRGGALSAHAAGDAAHPRRIRRCAPRSGALRAISQWPRRRRSAPSRASS